MTDRPIIFSAPMIRALLAGQKVATRRVLKPQPVFFDVPIEAGRGVGRPGRPDELWPFRCMSLPDERDFERWAKRAKAPYAVGDRLWVKEGWQVVRETLDYETGGEHDVFEWNEEDYGDPRQYLNGDARFGCCAGLFYKADGEDENPSNFYPLTGLRGEELRPAEIDWRTPLFMPRWASRITLTVTGVRIERLQSISEVDAVAEGVGRIGADFPNSDWSGGPNFWTVDLPTKGIGFSANSPTAAGAFRMLWEHIHGEDAWDANPFVVALTFEVERRNIDAAPEPAEAVPESANTEEPIWF